MGVYRWEVPVMRVFAESEEQPVATRRLVRSYKDICAPTATDAWEIAKHATMLDVFDDSGSLSSYYNAKLVPGYIHCQGEVDEERPDPSGVQESVLRDLSSMCRELSGALKTLLHPGHTHDPEPILRVAKKSEPEPEPEPEPEEGGLLDGIKSMCEEFGIDCTDKDADVMAMMSELMVPQFPGEADSEFSAEELRNRLRQYQSRFGLTHAQMAQRLDMSRSGYDKLYRGETGGMRLATRRAALRLLVSADRLRSFPSDSDVQ